MLLHFKNKVWVWLSGITLVSYANGPRMKSLRTSEKNLGDGDYILDNEPFTEFGVRSNKYSEKFRLVHT